MNGENQHIAEELWAKFFAGECAEEEIALVNAWKDKSEENRQEFELMKQIWTLSGSAVTSDSIDVDAAWQSVDKQTSGKVISINKPESKAKIAFSWAAMIAALFIIGSLIWLNNSNDTTSQFAEALTGKSPSELTLPDGSVVNLDTDSRLKHFKINDGELREVWLDGQAFFSIAPDKEHPFIVHTDVSDIKVVGTAFEVNTRTEGTVNVKVEEGIVSVSNRNSADVKQIVKGELAIVSEEMSEIIVAEISDPAAFYWKDKTIKFKRTNMFVVAETLKNAMGIDLEFSSDKIGNCEITATFKNESPESIIDIIATTLGLTYSKSNQAYTLTGEGC